VYRECAEQSFLSGYSGVSNKDAAGKDLMSDGACPWHKSATVILCLPHVSASE
jgi:hypothetical protein